MMMDPTPLQHQRTRKTETAKTLWKTVWPMLAQSLLYICITGLMFKYMVIGNMVEFSNIEGRIAKMVQVQIEVVDKKVDCLITNLKNDFNKKFSERSEVLEPSFDDLVRLKGSGDVEVSLDEIREIAKEIVVKEIDKHAADGLGMVDYASFDGGGRILNYSEAVGDSEEDREGIFHPLKMLYKKRMMLTPSFGESGQCFALKGNNGFVHIQLQEAIVPEAITLEHVSKSVSQQSSAPKHCRVSGWMQGQKGIETELIKFTYDLEKHNVQTFKVLDRVRCTVVDTVRFEFTSNHGNPNYTCIYRLRVHGHEPTS